MMNAKDMQEGLGLRYRAASDGFTLIELIVTLVIAALIATYAVPGFQNLVASNRVSAKANSLVSSFTLARSEAVKLGSPVTVKAVNDDFTQGWCVYQGSAGSDCDESGITVVRHFEGTDQLSISSNATAVEFDGQGRLSQGGTVEIDVEPSDCGASEKRRRAITINAVGRASTSREECN